MIGLAEEFLHKSLQISAQDALVYLPRHQLLDIVKAFGTLLGAHDALLKAMGSGGFAGTKLSEVSDQAVNQADITRIFLQQAIYQLADLLIEGILFQVVNFGPANARCSKLVEDASGRVIFTIEKRGV